MIDPRLVHEASGWGPDQLMGPRVWSYKGFIFNHCHRTTNHSNPLHFYHMGPSKRHQRATKPPPQCLSSRSPFVSLADQSHSTLAHDEIEQRQGKAHGS